MPNVYAQQVKNAINYFLARTGSTVVFKRLRTRGDWSPSGLTARWWEVVSATAVVYDATIKEIEESGGRIRLGDKAFVILNSIFTDHSATSFIPFNSGSVEFTAGETITGATNGATAVVVSWYEDSGTWASANAVGGLYVNTVVGTFIAENLNGSAGGLNMASATAAQTLMGTDLVRAEPGDEITYSGETYYVEMDGVDTKGSAIVREDITKTTSTIYARARNI